MLLGGLFEPLLDLFEPEAGGGGEGVEAVERGRVIDSESDCFGGWRWR